MNCGIVHELPGRIRLRYRRGFSFTEGEAGIIEYLLEAQDGVLDVTASHVTGSILVLFEPGGPSSGEAGKMGKAGEPGRES